MEWGKFGRGVFLVNVLGIVYSPKKRKILIGKRESDPHLKGLSWCFPGGRPDYKKEIESCLKSEIRKKTGLKVKVKEAVFAKTYPEKREFLSIYYYCEPAGGREKAGEKFTELKWVRPSEVKKCFTTSLSPGLLEYLKSLE
jgi:ADP-ribose pyrophosphatase YjhB (NUDIX family)